MFFLVSVPIHFLSLTSTIKKCDKLCSPCTLDTNQINYSTRFLSFLLNLFFFPSFPRGCRLHPLIPDTVSNLYTCNNHATKSFPRFIICCCDCNYFPILLILILLLQLPLAMIVTLKLYQKVRPQTVTANFCSVKFSTFWTSFPNFDRYSSCWMILNQTATIVP